MPHKLESAHVSFGLVTIPVGIYSAIEEQEIHFNQLHGVCGSRIKQRRFCPTCNRDVEYDELVKGYEIAKEIKGVGIYNASAASQMLSRDFKKAF